MTLPAPDNSDYDWLQQDGSTAREEAIRTINEMHGKYTEAQLERHFNQPDDAA
jgi:hypothetical protein